jgi:hypothetical protein
MGRRVVVDAGYRNIKDQRSAGRRGEAFRLPGRRAQRPRESRARRELY